MATQPTSVTDFVIARACKYPQIQKIMLFGSRARADFRNTSDYDIAVFAEGLPRGEWARFSLDVEEDAPTLCGIDLVFMSDAISSELRERIHKEGKVIYEAKP